MSNSILWILIYWLTCAGLCFWWMETHDEKTQNIPELIIFMIVSALLPLFFIASFMGKWIKYKRDVDKDS